MNRFLAYMVAIEFIILWQFLAILPRGVHLPPPPEAVVQTVQASGFHDAGYEEAWIQFIDEKERLVQVQAVDSRIVIVFRLKKKEDLARYPEGHITPITPLCRGGGTDCDIGSQEKLYVGNVEVQPVMWKTFGANRKLKIKKP